VIYNRKKDTPQEKYDFAALFIPLSLFFEHKEGLPEKSDIFLADKMVKSPIPNGGSEAINEQ
jgi:hypothetical protein